MTAIDVVAVAYGHEALAALVALVNEVKRDDPLAPLTIIVPSNTIGVFTRRRLSGDRGIIAVNFLTVYRLGELLGAPSLAARGRRPVSTPVVVAALSRALRRDPGSFAAVIDHPSTAEALFDRYRELSNVSSAALAAFTRGASPRVRDIARVVASARSHLAPQWYDEADLLDAATEAVLSGHSFVGTLGRVVIYLPQDLTVPEGRLLGSVADRMPVTVIAGFTGESRADEGITRSLRRVGAPEPRLDRREPAPYVVTTASDPDAEVRAAVGHVLTTARTGTPFESMALLYPSDRPYRRLVADHLSSAAVPWNGPATTPLSDRIAGRTLRMLLALGDRQFHRSAVFDLLAAVPIRDASGRLAPVARWERISREAGVVAGLDEWRSRLSSFATGEEQTAIVADRDPKREGRAALARRRAEQTHELLAFVGDLADRLARASSLRSWSDLADWTRTTSRRLLGSEQLRQRWSEGERIAADRVDEILDRLSALDAVDPVVTLASFTRAIERELDDDIGRIGSFGDGLLVGPLGAAVGLDLEHVVIVGAAEGLLPSGSGDDALIPDVDREQALGELDPSRARLDRQHRHFLAALAASRRSAALFAPRGDLRRPAEQPLSRWIDRAIPTALPSFAASAESDRFPATAQIARLRALVQADGSLADLGRRDVVIGRGLRLLNARRSATFTEFDGNLAGLPQRPRLVGSTASATRLETWVQCPFAYFVNYVLGVEPVDDPEDHFEMTALDRGRLLHETLDEFFGRIGGALPDPTTPWDGGARALLHAVFTEQASEYEHRGLTGRPLLWARERRNLAADLDEFLRNDTLHRARYRTREVHGEVSFGTEEPFTLRLPDGRALALRGSIDRIDRTDDGAVVIDYKSGSDRNYKSLSIENPLADGARLQLPIYAQAARSAFGIEGDIDAFYWFVSRNKATGTRGYRVDDHAIAALTTALGVIVGGIEAGVFVARPSEPKSFRLYNDCPACDPDSLGTADVHRLWLAKSSDPEIAPYLSVGGAGDE